jgi:hypothetical protein
MTIEVVHAGFDDAKDQDAKAVESRIDEGDLLEVDPVR